MSWIADLHIHSHFSMATSKDCNPINLNRWAGLKGVSLVGTGDFTHPGWRKELRDHLILAESGFYRLKETPKSEIPDQPEVQFVMTGELSTIYKKNGRVRKVHHLIILPSLEAADKVSNALEALGMNIRSDGRPILGLDSYRLFQLLLEQCPEAVLIPAHIWTPHFSVFGSNSGFDDIVECYEDLTPYITALETGLSSDPAMNWRWSALDRFNLVSNSDAHNPQNLAREANIFNSEFSFQGLQSALQTKDRTQFTGTLEFFPEEGKYHCDGHRNCEICWKPDETLAHLAICPRCGRKVTVGVLNRVVQLADRPDGYHPENAQSFQSLVPLREVIGSALGVGSSSRKVERVYFDLLQRFGPELTVLREVRIDEIARSTSPLIAEGIRRLRAGQVEIRPGYDGEYGVISVLREDDRQALLGQAALFEENITQLRKEKQVAASVVGTSAGKDKIQKVRSNSGPGLSTEQLAVIHSTAPTTIVIAGPGTGKTRTLVERIAYLIRDCQVDPALITGVTFTNKAAGEIRNRVGNLLPNRNLVSRLNIGTFHSIAWRILNENPEGFRLKLIDQAGARTIMEEVLRRKQTKVTTREALLAVSKLKNQAALADSDAWSDICEAYQQQLAIYQRLDFDDIIRQIIQLWEAAPQWLAAIQPRFSYLLVDEFQDLNAMQYHLTKLWSQNSRSLLAIGDPNQAIYGFRGANPEFFEQIQVERLQTERLKLAANFRSTPVVVKAANQVIAVEYRQQTMDGESETGAKIVWMETPSEREAARAIIREIVKLLGGSSMLTAHGAKGGNRQRNIDQSYGLGDIAILFRTGRQADSLEKMLEVEGLPYRVVGQTATFEAPAVAELLDLVRMVLEPEDLYLFRTVLRQPRWNLTGNEVASIIDSLATLCERSLSLLDLMQPLVDGIPSLTVKLTPLVEMARHLGELVEAQNGPGLIRIWMEQTNQSGNIELEHLLQYCEEQPEIKAMLEFIPLALEGDLSRKGLNSGDAPETITLSTLHASKGLEFPVVFIAGVEEGLLPYGETNAEQSVAEEQRLFYVGLTRAQQRLYLSNSRFRNRAGEQVVIQPSRFIELIPAELMIKEEHQVKERAEQLGLFPE